ncbi:MAG: exopolyphosphatase, partial [Rhodothermia bacterium]|nr:exopolyphosphatase [Rhodothermia bacterium]
LSAVTEHGDAMPMHSETRFVRLGQGIDASGTLHPDALDRLRQTLSEFAAISRKAGASNVMVAGTSASRDAEDPDELIRFVKHETGLDYTIVSGEEEALLTSIGALSCIDRPYDTAVIVDIGGGSTELTYVDGGKDLTIRRAVSLDIGSVRITERCFTKLPPEPEDVEKAIGTVNQTVGMVAPPAIERGDLVFVGAAGTIRALALIDRGVTSWAEFDNAEVVIDRSTCSAWCDRLLGMDYEATLALNPIVMRGRADVFAAGVLILNQIFDLLDEEECVVSPRGLRHGLAIRYASLKKKRGE